MKPLSSVPLQGGLLASHTFDKARKVCQGQTFLDSIKILKLLIAKVLYHWVMDKFIFHVQNKNKNKTDDCDEIDYINLFITVLQACGEVFLAKTSAMS